LFLTGEWFIGTIVWIFLFSPLIYKFLRKSVPATVIGSVIIAGITANFLQDFETQGRIFAVQTIFLVRMPEFIIGMVLFMYRDKIFKNSSCAVAILLTVAMVIYSALSDINHQSVWLRYYFGEVINVHFVLAAVLSVYVSFIAADFMNKNFGKFMAKFNSFKDISYMAVLIQHLVIHLFERFINFNSIGLIGATVTFIVIMVLIILMSELMKKYYTPFEKKLLG
jgi:peptidoglycan/LPS O-acetylase OafA/YrhL